MITVVIPSHNRVDELKRALHSVYVQSEKPSEIIVVDDGSSPQVENSIFVDCPEEITTKLLRNVVPRWANHARNRGIESASGEWIAFLDDDDEFEPDKIKRLLEEIAKFDHVDVLYHPAKIFMENENISYYTSPKQNIESIFCELLISNIIGGTPMVTVRRERLIDVGSFDEELASLQDYELWLRLAKANKKFKYINEPLTKCYYTTKRQSVSKSIERNKTSINIIEEKYKNDYEKLSEGEKRKHEEWKKRMRVHKALLNMQYSVAVKEQFKSFLMYPSFKGLLQTGVVLLGSKTAFRLKSKLG